MTQKELDEMEIEARKITLNYFWKDLDPDECLKRYNRLVRRIPLLICLAPPLLICTISYLADESLPSSGMIKVILGIIVFWEGVRLFMVWFINKGTVMVMQQMIEDAKKDKEGDGEPNNKGREDNGGHSGS